MNGSMNVDDMRDRRADVERQIDKLRVERDSLNRSIRDAESRAWVAVNGITPDRVQFSSGDDVPWHGHVSAFATWMRQQVAPKPYAEWNGRVYLTTDLLNGRMPETPGLIEHVQEARS